VEQQVVHVPEPGLRSTRAGRGDPEKAASLFGRDVVRVGHVETTVLLASEHA
jgi:hypothetical protein